MTTDSPDDVERPRRKPLFGVGILVLALVAFGGGTVGARALLLDSPEPVEGEPAGSELVRPPVAFARGTSATGTAWEASASSDVGGSICIDVEALSSELAGNSVGGCFDPNYGQPQVMRAIIGEEAVVWGLIPADMGARPGGRVVVEFQGGASEANVDDQGLFVVTGLGVPLTYVVGPAGDQASSYTFGPTRKK